MAPGRHRPPPARHPPATRRAADEETDLDAADILRMTERSPEVDLADGELVLRQGERTDGLYVLVAGVLEVQRRGRAVVQISEPGAVVGELGLLLESPASADVLAVGPTRVRRVADARELFEQSPEFARHLATVLARRLWQISTYLSDLQEQFAGKGEIFELVPTVLRELLGDTRPAPDPGSDREPDSPY